MGRRAIGLLILAAVSVTALWLTLASGDPQDSVRLDVVRTASSIVVGTGGAAALLLRGAAAAIPDGAGRGPSPAGGTALVGGLQRWDDPVVQRHRVDGA